MRLQQKKSTLSDAVSALLGAGEHLWKAEPGDAFVQRLRLEDTPAEAPPENTANRDLLEDVWRRLLEYQGAEFRTATGLPLTYQVEGSGIWFFREGKRVNRKLTRTQVNIAIGRCPLQNTTEIKDLIDYPYLFALLDDGRIREGNW